MRGGDIVPCRPRLQAARRDARGRRWALQGSRRRTGSGRRGIVRDLPAGLRQGGGSGRGGAVLGIGAPAPAPAPAWLEVAPKVYVPPACPPRRGSGAAPGRPCRNGGAAVGEGRCGLVGRGRPHCVWFRICPAASGSPLHVPPRAGRGPSRPADRRSRRRRLRRPAAMLLSPGFAAAKRAGCGHSPRGSAGCAPPDAPRPGYAACGRAPSRVAAGR